MNSIYVDSRFNDEKRRQLLYDGQLLFTRPGPRLWPSPISLVK